MNCRVPVEKGISLATDVYLPTGAKSFPTILMRTPYHRAMAHRTARTFVERGYAFVVQDCRGKYDSDGAFRPLVYEAQDGQATLDWTANQTWCNGVIGLWGRSYPGIVQVPAAAGGHEALRCMAPSVTPGSYFRDWVRYDGCFAFANIVRWMMTHTTCRTKPAIDHFSWEELYHLVSLEKIQSRAGFMSPVVKEMAEHDRYDAYWESIDQAGMHPDVRVPGYHVGGWFDHLTGGSIRAYQNIGTSGATEAARRGQRLLIGPWGHKTSGHTYGDWDFTPEADVSVFAHEFQFFDYHLKGIDNGYTAGAPVKVFLMGLNRWERLRSWPPADARVEAWHLDSDGAANMAVGGGRLTAETPSASEADRYTYDPADPVPAWGGPIYWGCDPVGPIDQRPILDRSDILVYRSEKLGEPLAVMGDVELELTVASTAEDTDFIAKLCVEEASGAVTVLRVGSLRCRYRNSWSDPEPLQTDQATPIRINLGSTAYVFPEGSRVVLTVTSSDFPRIYPHPNTMAAPWSEKEQVVARNTVMHGPDGPSRLLLPVVML